MIAIQVMSTLRLQETISTIQKEPILTPIHRYTKVKVQEQLTTCFKTINECDLKGKKGMVFSV